ADEFDAEQLDGLREGLNQLLRNTRELQESILSIRMLPIQNAFARLPRLVRDLSRKLGKSVDLVLNGEHTEVDKTVLEKIGDPLIHLVRNALDHGIEQPEDRVASGKPVSGRLEVSAYHESGSIVIEISDDGAGLNHERILARGRERGLIQPDEEPTEERIFNLIFQPGFSTAVEVSDVSGRGVGMDVVRRNIKDLGGNIDIRSVSGQGSTVIIRLPLTLAILDGQLIRVGDQVYVLPLLSIVESQKVRRQCYKTVVGSNEVYALRDEYIPVVRIEDLFHLTPSELPLEKRLLVVVEVDDIQAGLLVDDLLAQQQVVIKSLETNFQTVEGLAGATILGDGSVAMIIDPSELLRKHLGTMSPVSLPDAA
ncbi:MAG: chemotaxis protein CheA, partial [Pseudomonadota bacterium]|nr:chemotaxis protein CheA [Pseudomonadota bacterium]